MLFETRKNPLRVEKILVCQDPKNYRAGMAKIGYRLRTDGRMDRETCQLKYYFRFHNCDYTNGRLQCLKALVQPDINAFGEIKQSQLLLNLLLPVPCLPLLLLQVLHCHPLQHQNQLLKIPIGLL